MDKHRTAVKMVIGEQLLQILMLNHSLDVHRPIAELEAAAGVGKAVKPDLKTVKE